MTEEIQAALRTAAQDIRRKLPCPNCDGSGVFATPDRFGEASDLQQCQWCDEVDTAITTILAESIGPILEIVLPITVLHVDGERFDRLCPEFKDETNNQRIRWALEDRLRDALAAFLTKGRDT